MMHHDEELCSLIARAKWSEGDLGRAQSLVAYVDDAFWKLASFNGVSILAAKKLEPLGVNIPSDIVQQMAQTQVRNMKRREEFLSLAKALNAEGIETFLLKGFLLGELVYRDAGYKRMNDIDILVKPNDVLRTAEIARQHGFNFATSAMIGSQPIDFRLHHSPPLISADRETIIGLHWNLASSFAKRRPRSDIFEGARSLTVEEVPLKYLCHEYNLLHLCMHLPFFKVGVRELADVSNLVIHAASGLDFDKVISTASTWRTSDALFRVLTLAHHVIPCLSASQESALEEMGETLQASRYVSDTKARAANRSLLLRSRSVYVGKVEKNYALFKLASHFSDRFFHLKEQWRLVLRVPKEERARLLIHQGWFARTRASWALCFAMAQDLGPALLAAVTVKNILSLFKPAKSDQRDFIMAKQILENME